MSAAIEATPVTSSRLDLDTVKIDPKWALKIPASLAIRKRVLPLCKIANTVTVACLRVPDSHTQSTLERYLGTELQWVLAEANGLQTAMDRVYQQLGSSGIEESRQKMKGLRDEADDAVNLCDELFQAALLRAASDIHLIPDERGLAVHLRVDGVLEPYRELSKSVQPFVINRLKVLAGMDIAEKRSAQDGRIATYIGNSRQRLEVRVASLPTRYGERITLRVLGNQSTDLSLKSLGMSPEDLRKFSSATERPHGLILLTGPTGSGKSTTLYAAIQQLLSSQGLNVITVEDPIEYEIQGASQVEVDSADKVNFSKALRSILRHDPDVVMIGEIRDEETANTAIKAALTGHLVFSTVHTNTSAGVVTRLIDMAVQPFLVAATLRLAVAQRLVRKLCPACRQPRPITLEESLIFGQPQLEGLTSFDAKGCVHCAGKGYSGRIGLFEMLECTSELSKSIAECVGEADIAEYARRHGGRTLLDDGIAKVLNGTTTIAEIASAIAWE